MTGKPAARIDDNVAYGKIVTGSLTVLIGSQGGVACSVCPGGKKVGSPVNPQLGAKVLSGASDLDFALPGAMPLVWQRQYSSYVNAQHGGYCAIARVHRFPRSAYAKREANWCTAVPNSAASPPVTSVVPRQMSCTSHRWN